MDETKYQEYIETIDKNPKVIDILDEREKFLWIEYKQSNGDIKATAKALGISPSYVNRILLRVFFKAKKFNE